MQPEGGRAGVGAVPWTERETRDLISIWDAKLLEVLSDSRRKIIVDGFQRIAEQMAVRGHRRSALECWTKIGALRVEYRRVFAHNAFRWRAPQTCPFYSQLDRILQGDGIPKPFRISGSLKVRVQEEPVPPPSNTDEVGGSSSAASVPLGIPVSETVTASAEEANKTITEELLENTESLNRRKCQNAPTPPTRIKQEVVDDEAGVAQLSPTSYLANARTKRKCVSGLHSAAERMVAQPSKQCKEKPGPMGKGTRKSQEAHRKGRKEAGKAMRSRCTVMKT